MARREPRIFYGWWVVGACFTSMLITGGAIFFSLPVFIKPLGETFGWSRADLSAGIQAIFVSMGIGGPIVGGLTTRYGSRAVMIPAAAVTGLALVLLSGLQHLWELYALRLLMGFGYAALAFVPVNVTIYRWFTTKRGRAVGIALAGLPVGGLLFTPVTAVLIDTLSWRGTFLVLGLLMWLVLLPVLFFVLRDNPKDLGLVPDGAAAKGTRSAESARAAGQDLTFGEALRTRSFWALLGVYLMMYASLYSVLVHQFPYMTDQGYSPTGAGLVVSALLAVSVVGGLCFGWASERFEARHLAAACLALAAAAASLLTRPLTVGIVAGYAVLLGLSFGGIPALMAMLIGRTFGTRSYGALYGFYQGLVCVGAFIGPTVLGYLYDQTSSYGHGFILLAIGFTLSAGLILLVRSVRPLDVGTRGKV